MGNLTGIHHSFLGHLNEINSTNNNNNNTNKAFKRHRPLSLTGINSSLEYSQNPQRISEVSSSNNF